MPFTVSHAVVALPFARSALPVGAIAIGSMAPDLPLFLPIGVDYAHTHGVPSFLYSSLPLAFVLFVIWRVLLRPAPRALSPGFLAERLPADWSGSTASGWRSVWASPGVPGSIAARSVVVNLTLLVAALLIGVVSHILWDEFTHPDRGGEALIPALGESWNGIPVAVWLQYLSSVFGLVVLVVWAAFRLRRQRRSAVSRSRSIAATRLGYWISMAVAVVVVPGIVATLDGVPTTVHDALNFALDAGTPLGAVILLETAVAAVIVSARRGARGR